MKVGANVFNSGEDVLFGIHSINMGGDQTAQLIVFWHVERVWA